MNVRLFGRLVAAFPLSCVGVKNLLGKCGGSEKNNCGDDDKFFHDGLPFKGVGKFAQKFTLGAIYSWKVAASMSEFHSEI